MILGKHFENIRGRYFNICTLYGIYLDNYHAIDEPLSVYLISCKSQANLRQILRLISCEIHANLMEISCKSHANLMQISSKSQANLKQNLMQISVKFQAKPRQISGKYLANLMQI